MKKINKESTDIKKSTGDFYIYEETVENKMSKKINLLSSAQINQFIKKLSNPQFLGSIHIKNNTNFNFNSINDILKNKLD